MSVIETAEHRLALRFNHADTWQLRLLAERARTHELDPGATQLFTQAAQAAHTGEPLIVVCQTPMEAVLIAHGFTRYGITQPVVEQLNSA